MIEEAGIKERVIIDNRFIPIREIADYFIASDIVVFPYKDTTTSASIQIAFAFSKPVIVTETGSFSEVVEEGKNGIIIPPENPERLSEGIIKLLSISEEDRKKMGEYGREIAMKKFNWLDIASKTMDVYVEAI